VGPTWQSLFFFSFSFSPLSSCPPLWPCPSRSAVPPASQPYAASQPSAASISHSSSSSSPLPNRFSGCGSLPSPPSRSSLRGGATWRGGRAEEATHDSMRGDSGMHRGSSSEGDESGSHRANRAPGVANRVPVGSGALGMEETASASSGRQTPDGRELVPRRRRRPSPGGGGARLQGGCEGELGAATVCGGDRPMPTEVREEGQQARRGRELRRSETAREAAPGGGGREQRLQPWSRGSLLHPQEKGPEGVWEREHCWGRSRGSAGL
jgi:hypothetical protein